MYVSAVQEYAVKVSDGEQLRSLLRDERLRWPDTFAHADATVYITASHTPDMN